MKIEFYHIDAFETAHYQPIWKELIRLGVDARLVAVPGSKSRALAGWFDFERCQSYCVERALPLHTEIDPTADLAVTTQNAHMLADYRRRVRLMYGPRLYPDAWSLQPHAVQPFDRVLVHGQAYASRFSQWLPPERLHVIGYPMYDEFFKGVPRRDEVRAGWGVADTRPTAIFMPTWGNNTCFERFFPQLCELSHKYNIILRPHHCTVRQEPARMERMRASGMPILDSAFDITSCYAGGDVILADVRSGALSEAAMCGVPCVGLVLDEREMNGWLAREGVGRMVSLCHWPAKLDDAIDQALTSQQQRSARQEWAEAQVAHRDGTAATRAAQTLIALASKEPRRRTYLMPEAGRAHPVKVSVVLPTYNHGHYLPQAVQSILAQTMEDFELIIVNDGSTDHTAAMLANFHHPKVKVLTQENRGLPAALNAGFAEAAGRYWTWTSADNVVAQSWLEELSRALDEAPPEVGYALSYYANINEAGQIISVNSGQCFETFNLLLSSGNASFLYRSDVAKATGLYDTALNGAEDLDMWLRMSVITRAVLVESVLYYYRLHDDTMTAKIPGEVASSAIRTLQKFITVNGGLDVDLIFPGIAASPNPALARWQARIWLATRLAQSQRVAAGIVVDTLFTAIHEQYDPSLVGNMVVLLARDGEWERAAQIVEYVARKAPSPAIEQLRGIVATRNAEAAAALPFVTIGTELLSFPVMTQMSRRQAIGR